MWPVLRPRHGIPDDKEPCFQCKMPMLWEDNLFAWEVFQLCYSEMHVVGMGTVLGLKFAGINEAMRRVGISKWDEDTVFRRVKITGDEYARFLQQQTAREERQRAARNKQRVTVKSAVLWPPFFDQLQLPEAHEEKPLYPDAWEV